MPGDSAGDVWGVAFYFRGGQHGHFSRNARAAVARERPILRRTRRIDTQPRPRMFAGAHVASQAWPLVRCVWQCPRTSRAVAGARCAWAALLFRDVCGTGIWCKRRHIRLV